MNIPSKQEILDLLKYLNIDVNVFRSQPRVEYLFWLELILRLTDDEASKLKTWDLSYHGTIRQNVGKIINSRQLRPADDKEIFVRPGHIKNSYYYYTSPSFNYASFALYATPFKYNGNWYQLVLKIRQLPGSYVVRRDTIQLPIDMLDGIAREWIEYVSSDPSHNFVESLLVRKINPYDCEGAKTMPCVLIRMGYPKKDPDNLDVDEENSHVWIQPMYSHPFVNTR